jgi:hypothetical protein
VIEKLDEGMAVYGGENLIVGPNGSSIPARVKWQQWPVGGCPAGKRCNGDGANLWICWADVCHAAADARIGNWIEALSDWSQGVVVHLD